MAVRTTSEVSLWLQLSFALLLYLLVLPNDDHGMVHGNDVDPKFAAHVIAYHINEVNYSAQDLVNMNSADQLGDIYFDVRSIMAPIECKDDPTSHDCYNPEVVGTTPLAVTKLNLTIDTRFANYSKCNVAAGIYTCSCPSMPCPPNVGFTTVRNFFVSDQKRPSAHAPEWQWWRFNLANYTGGVWYSTVASGQCLPTATGPCFWKVENVIKRIGKNCSDASIIRAVTGAGSSCFDACPQPTNTTSTCWIACFYTTLMGPKAGSAPLSGHTGMPLDLLQRAFELPFTTSDPPSGCPSV